MFERFDQMRDSAVPCVIFPDESPLTMDAANNANPTDDHATLQ